MTRRIFSDLVKVREVQARRQKAKQAQLQEDLDQAAAVKQQDEANEVCSITTRCTQ